MAGRLGRTIGGAGRLPLRGEPQPDPTHSQFQVILKPGPGDPRGFTWGVSGPRHDSDAHESASSRTTGPRPRSAPGASAGKSGSTAWRSPSTPTFSKRAGALDPVAVEITYGVERILMAIQGVSHFSEIHYEREAHLR